MSIFRKKQSCCGQIYAETLKQVITAKETGKSVKILGSGCKKCNELEKNTLEALKSLGMDMELEHVTDFAKIASYGVMTTPALVVDNIVVSYGKVLKVDEITEILKNFAK